MRFRTRALRVAYVAEAVLWLLLARLALRLLAFDHIVARLSSAPDVEVTGGRRRVLRKRVKTAVFQAWRRLPVSNTCFHRAIAAQLMLRRRGVGTIVYYGARTEPERGLTGHVWLMDGDIGVVGHDAAQGYPVLAQFSGKTMRHAVAADIKPL